MSHPAAHPATYSRAQKALHWITAAVIVAQFVFHEAMADAWDRIEDGLTVAFDPLVMAHVAGGFAVLAFALWRLALRATRGAPAPQGSPLVQRAAHWGHIALYAVMIVMAVTGGMAWFGGIEAAAELHETLKPALLVLVAGHVAAAIWHQVVLKDGTLGRMR
jgi:cytochrome b561